MLRKLILTGLGIATMLYITMFFLLRYGQNRIIFSPDSQIKSTPQKYNLDYQDVWIDINQDQIHGWWIPAAEKSAPALLYFHGNGSNNGDLIEIAALFHSLGVSLLFIDYRGYGKSSPIFPNETRVYEDAEASWQYLTTELQTPPQQAFVYGHSLGGAIAIELATKHPDMGGLITEGTFTSMTDMASLSLAASEPKQLAVILQANHNNLPEFGGEQYLLTLKQFIQSAQSSQITTIVNTTKIQCQ